VAISCVHVLGLEEGRSGIEDLPMLARLEELLPSSVEVSEWHTHHRIISQPTRPTAYPYKLPT
jgi:hypothetical protein